MKITTKRHCLMEYFRRRAMMNPRYKAEAWIFYVEQRATWG